jgi:hypothetical protein
MSGSGLTRPRGRQAKVRLGRRLGWHARVRADAGTAAGSRGGDTPPARATAQAHYYRLYRRTWRFGVNITSAAVP